MARSDTVKSVVQSDIEELGDLVGVEPTLAAVAARLAEAIDKAAIEEPRILPALAKELRSTLRVLVDGRDGEEDDDDAGLDTPS